MIIALVFFLYMNIICNILGKGSMLFPECEFHAKCAFTLGGKCEGHAMH